jgi:hypothetical protein
MRSAAQLPRREILQFERGFGTMKEGSQESNSLELGDSFRCLPSLDLPSSS